ncbi:MAG: hypothetical protein P8170_08935 [Gemmatimonadota bacterium]
MDLAAVRIGDGEIVSSTDTDFMERSISLSPNGRWLAYESDRTGDTEVYIRSFPDLSERFEPGSSAGGMSPVWSPRGDELFYLNGARQMVSVPVDAAEDLVIGREQVLFDIPDGVLTDPGDYYAQYERDRAARRFMMLLAPGASDAPRLAILLNAFSLLDGRG